MDSNPLISVIVPFYNPKFEYFTEAIECLLSQSYTNLEVVIVNDGSNHESKRLLLSYIDSLNDNRFTILNLEKNCGVSIAKNKGIELSCGEIITFLDSDDLFLPRYCEEIINFFVSNPSCKVLFVPCLSYVSFGKYKKVFENRFFFKIKCGLDLSEKKKQILTMVKNAKASINPMIIAKSEVFKIISFNPTLNFGEDTDLCFQIFSSNNLLEGFSSALILGYLYRNYPSSKRLTKNVEKVFESINYLILRYGGEDSLPGEIVRCFKNNYDSWRYAELICSKSFVKLLKSRSFSRKNVEGIKYYIKQLFLSISIFSFIAFYLNFLKSLSFSKKIKLQSLVDRIVL